METLTQLLVKAGYKDRFLDQSQVARIAGGSDKRVHGLVHRAIKAGELIRIERGLYLLDNQFRQHPWHPFGVAQALRSGSYISMESALAYHDWIPEAVPTTLSISNHRQTKITEHPVLGLYRFLPLALFPHSFYQLVERHVVEKQSVFIASPARALMDLVCYRKVEWQSIEWCTVGMRIDIEYFSSSISDFEQLVDVYKQYKPNKFLDSLLETLKGYQQFSL